MKRSASSYIKLSLASALVLVSCCLCSWRLMKIQVVESETYSQTKTSTQTYSQTIQATRGEIVDSSGKPIIENKVGYSLIIEPDTFPEDNTEGNQVLLSLTKILDENQVTYTTSLPISETQPYAFTEDEDAVAKLKKTLNMNVYATKRNMKSMTTIRRSSSGFWPAFAMKCSCVAFPSATVSPWQKTCLWTL